VAEKELDARNEAAALAQAASNLSFVGRYEESLVLFEQALALDGDMARAHMGRAVTLAQLGRAAEGLTSAQKAIRLEPGNALAYTTLGLSLYRLGRRGEAEAAYEKAAAITPENPGVLYNYACFWALAGEENKCREFLTRAFQYLESGVIEHSKKDRDLQRYVRSRWFAELHTAATMLEEALAQFLAGRYAEALEAFEKALRVNHRHVRAHAGRSFSLAQLGRADEGLAAAEEAVRLNPHYARGHSAKAVCLHRLRRRGEAQTAYERAIELAPDDAAILYNFACFWAEVGDENRCRHHLTRALRWDDGQVAAHAPNDPDMARYRNADWFREAIAGAKKLRRAAQPKGPI
jgi:protein O-GlcNAc transferase